MPTRDGVKEVAADMIVPGAVAGDLIVAPSPISLAGIHDVPIGSVLCSGGINLIPGWSSAPMVGGLLNLGSTPTLGLNNANTSPALVGARVQAGDLFGQFELCHILPLKQ